MIRLSSVALASTRVEIKPYLMGELSDYPFSLSDIRPPQLILQMGFFMTKSSFLYQNKEPCVAALFVQSTGCYSNLPWIDTWDEIRDARKYAGPFPVIARPPCQLWGALAAVNYSRWGGEHNRPGNDGGCFESAFESVNEWGGVLEHPAKTRAWKVYKIEKPVGVGWSKSGQGWVCEVWQSSYGHRANKATWLYYSGKTKPFDLRWDRPKGTHQIGFQDQRGKSRNKPTLNRKEANATPLWLRDELLKLAIHSSLSDKQIHNIYELSLFLK